MKYMESEEYVKIKTSKTTVLNNAQPPNGIFLDKNLKNSMAN